MYEFISIQFKKGNINKDKVLSYVPKYISEDEAQKIINGE